MSKIILNVPYLEKDKAKALGAKWDAEKKKWYITDAQNKNDFNQWIEREYEINVDSYGFAICSGYEVCWKCGKLSKVIGIMLPKNHSILDEDMPNMWSRCNYPCFVYYLNNINAKALKCISYVTQNYKLTFSKTTKSIYYMNSCEFCDAPLGDFHLYHAGGVFNPDNEYGIKDINVKHINCEFYAASDGQLTSELIDIYFNNL